MRERILAAMLFSIASIAALGQQYRNEWIDYNKTYYKFKIGSFGNDAIQGAPVKAGVVRIYGNTISQIANLAGTPAENFQLWRNGAQVPLYISKSTGTLTATDYIEFWGEINDGALDKDLYADTAYQLSDYWSLQTDSASYFLTVNSSGNNKRFQDAANDIAHAFIQPEANFQYTVGRFYRSRLNGGYNTNVSGELFFSSAYDRGEGYTSRAVTPSSSLPQGFSSLYADVNGPGMTVQINSAGNAKTDSRFVKLLLNNDSLVQYPMDAFKDAKITIAGIPATKIVNDAANFTVQDVSSSGDEMLVSKITLTYPRLFNFGNAGSFRFALAASDTGRLINITNFSNGIAPPVLYDFTNGKRYTADISIANSFRFYLPPSSTDYNLVLVRSDGSNAVQINAAAVKQKFFTDYSKAENQGDYLIISNPLIYGSGAANYVEQYKDYRNSKEGGAFHATIVNIEDLIDQFAYGVKKHPLSVKNFLRYARNNFAIKPSYVFIIGKGLVYAAYKANQTSALSDALNLVPTWGDPGSDNFLSSPDGYNPVPAIPVGRLSAVSAQEVGDYLQKVKHYESIQQATGSQNIGERSYLKKVIQIAGANDATIGPILTSITNKYTSIISDTLYGGIVNNFIETEDPTGYAQSVARFKSVYESGSGLVEYFGHSSATSLDFSLDNPNNYNTAGKYPVFIVNGCLAGNIFDYDNNRLNLRTTISEKFVLEPQKGAIGYISTTSWGLIDYLNVYTQQMYQSMSQSQYSKGFGNIVADALANGLNEIGGDDFYARCHAQQYAYHGDPAIKMNTFDKPDYAIDSSRISVQPSCISAADDSFNINLHLYNLGKAISDSVHLIIYRKYDNNDSATVFSKLIAPIKSIDSLSISLPVVPDRDTGIQSISVFIDDRNALSELDENNNYASVSFFVHQTGIRPVYPYNYSIVRDNNIILTASTINPLAGEQEYVMEIDTTALFNSPLKVHLTTTSVGGVIEYKNIQLTQDSVYYWRVSAAGMDHWSQFSFTHNPAGNSGFEQAHYFQHTQSAFNNIRVDSSRLFAFDTSLNNVYVQQSIYPYSGTEDNQFSIMVNGQINSASACIGSSIIFNIFDKLTFRPAENLTNPYGAAPTCDATRARNFEYNTLSASTRNNARQFLDSLPDGTWVIAKRNYDYGNNDWASVWAKDASPSLYQRFKDLGLPIDSFYKPRTFVFVFRKGDTTSFKPIAYFSQGLYDRITFSVNLPSLYTTGFITSPLFGPALAWNNLKWNGYSTESNDERNISVYGIDTAGNETLLFNLDSSQHRFNLSGMNATQYPFAKLRMENRDSLTANPYQLQNWLVEYQPVAEGAIAPNLGFSIPGTVVFKHPVNIMYDSLAGYVVFKNVSNFNFKPVASKIIMTDTTGNEFLFKLPDGKALIAGDTMHVSFNIDLRSLPEGLYNMELQVNPEHSQPEEYFFNNSLYKYIRIVRQSVLAVHLLHFTAQQQNDAVAVEWQIANPINIKQYEVEYSTDGLYFTRLAGVESNNSNIYTFLHTRPANGINYYRLKMISNDGTIEYSDIATVNVEKSFIVAGPNPFTNQLKITVTGSDNRTIIIKVFTSGGQLVTQRRFAGGTININTGTFAAGSYIIKIDDGQNSHILRLQKQFR